jgi:hypothetical protein
MMDRLELLASYREQTIQLLEVLNNAPDDLIDTDQLEARLAERDRLIAAFSELEGPPSEEINLRVQELEQMEQSVQTALSRLVLATRHKLQGFQNNQRLTNAYAGDYAQQAAFIDRKK